MGAGPYKVVSFKPGVELVLEAFDGYWRKAPTVKRLVMRSMPEEATRAAALRAARSTSRTCSTGPTADSVRQVSSSPGAPLVRRVLDRLPEQWDPKSPWSDQRVRLAASHAIDRPGLNQAEMLGFGRLTGNYVPRIFQSALPGATPYDPARAKKLLAEAGYPNGFDAGDFYPFPPYDSMGEAIIGYFQTVGIKSRMRTMERAAYFTAWREKRIHGVIKVITAAFGNAATRLEPTPTKNGVYAYGSLPEIDDLYAASGPRAGREEARGHGPPDPADHPRQGDGHPALRAGLHLGRGTTSGRRRRRPDPRLLVLGALRGSPAQRLRRARP